VFSSARSSRAATPKRPSHPTPRAVTIAIRPSARGGTCGKMLVICPTTQAPTLRQVNTTGNLRMALMRKLPVGQRPGCRHSGVPEEGTSDAQLRIGESRNWLAYSIIARFRVRCSAQNGSGICRDASPRNDVHG
jgi:hypothetical protein